MKGKIYSLSDPFTLEVRYIGFTRSTISTRYSQHKHEAIKKKKLSHLYNWFRVCIDKGKLPLVEVKEDNIPIEKWQEREQHWIDQYGNLTNQKKGGCGVHLNTNKKGRLRSIEAKRIEIIQLDLNGNYLKSWSSMRNVERHFSGKNTGLLAKASKTMGTAYGYLWVRGDEYDSNKVYLPKNKVKIEIFLFCAFTRKFIKRYNCKADLDRELDFGTSTACLRNNLLLRNTYYIRDSIVDNLVPPTPTDVYLFNKKYYTTYTILCRENNIQNKLHNVKFKKSLITKAVTEEMIQQLRLSFKNRRGK